MLSSDVVAHDGLARAAAPEQRGHRDGRRPARAGPASLRSTSGSAGRPTLATTSATRPASRRAAVPASCRPGTTSRRVGDREPRTEAGQRIGVVELLGSRAAGGRGRAGIRRWRHAGHPATRASDQGVNSDEGRMVHSDRTAQTAWVHRRAGRMIVSLVAAAAILAIPVPGAAADEGPASPSGAATPGPSASPPAPSSSPTAPGPSPTPTTLPPVFFEQPAAAPDDPARAVGAAVPTGPPGSTAQPRPAGPAELAVRTRPPAPTVPCRRPGWTTRTGTRSGC